ncbi:hypothetical protein M8C21_033263 [Ambrosia artemisiifolia]|uniref:Uncharacterized protein n=1 Tax=Ambrosia artemisiifolia TaxID=4212 RepID=A0AAD5BNG8_AMBAR|nr:hypothetical protein M8C21_033263 [Ambrosia artemisiifolia]
MRTISLEDDPRKVLLQWSTTAVVVIKGRRLGFCHETMAEAVCFQQLGCYPYLDTFGKCQKVQITLHTNTFFMQANFLAIASRHCRLTAVSVGYPRMVAEKMISPVTLNKLPCCSNTLDEQQLSLINSDGHIISEKTHD